MIEEKIKQGVELNGINAKISLEESRDSFNIRSKLFKKNEEIFKYINSFLTYPGLILSLVITSVAGISNFNDQSNPVTLSIFIMGLISSLLSGTSTFFNLNQRISKYNTTATHYQNLFLDLKAYLLMTRTRNELDIKLQQVKTQEIYITDYEIIPIF